MATGRQLNKDQDRIPAQVTHPRDPQVPEVQTLDENGFRAEASANTTGPGETGDRVLQPPEDLWGRC